MQLQRFVIGESCSFFWNPTFHILVPLQFPSQMWIFYLHTCPSSFGNILVHLVFISKSHLALPQLKYYIIIQYPLQCYILEILCRILCVPFWRWGKETWQNSKENSIHVVFIHFVNWSKIFLSISFTTKVLEVALWKWGSKEEFVLVNWFSLQIPLWKRCSASHRGMDCSM